MNKFCTKVDRVIKMAKAARTEMVQLSSGDLEFEEQVDNKSVCRDLDEHFHSYCNDLGDPDFNIKVINFFGLRDNLTEYLDLLKNCDSDGSQESKVVLCSPCLMCPRIKQQYIYYTINKILP